MIIEIPENFIFQSDSKSLKNNYAYEKNKKLIIVGNVSFERLMYALTYAIKDKEHCSYCGTYLTSSSRTLDHKYPIYFGGVTLSINLAPCCKSCNEKKSNLTSEQFDEFRYIENEVAAKNFRDECLRKNSAYNESFGRCLPDEWITNRKRSKILAEIDLDESYYKGKRYKAIKSFYKKYNNLPRPIILSSNSVLLDGFLILMFAKNANISKVPTIVLDNVIVM